MDIDEALAYIRDNPGGVLATIMPDGRPHLTVVFAVPIEGALWISSTQDRIKTKNLRRDPRATFTSGSSAWVAVEGMVALQDGDDVLERMRRYYRAARGEHPDWDDYDAAMVRDRRLILELVPERAYGYTG
jgi:PPOX class probable F420-dependent enzyme